MKVVKAAAVQLSPVLYSREGTIDKVVQKIHELGQQAVQFATFPETVVPYYPSAAFRQSAPVRAPMPQRPPNAASQRLLPLPRNG
jgi:nitrilase